MFAPIKRVCLSMLYVCVPGLMRARTSSPAVNDGDDDNVAYLSLSGQSTRLHCHRERGSGKLQLVAHFEIHPPPGMFEIKGNPLFSLSGL